MSELDDVVIVRSNGSSMYLLSAVCDNCQMGIIQVIRCDDHLTNTFRQYLIYVRVMNGKYMNLLMYL
jgi:glutamyl-tRNA synthetase